MFTSMCIGYLIIYFCANLVCVIVLYHNALNDHIPTINDIDIVVSCYVIQDLYKICV